MPEGLKDTAFPLIFLLQLELRLYHLPCEEARDVLSVFKASCELCFVPHFQLHNAQGQVKSPLLCRSLSPKEIIWQ